MVLPKPGTPQFDEFMRKAQKPGSMEANIIRSVNDDAAAQMQGQVRLMLYHMIEAVPGQLFRDIGRFHAKFGLEPTDDPNHIIPDDLLHFRIKFMYEELCEYMQALGVEWAGDALDIRRVRFSLEDISMEKAFDALIDLAYVVLGTAFLHRFPFNQGWDRVQAANMAKVRADGAGDERSHRKHSADVVKPEGWQAPILSDLLGPESLRCSCQEPGGVLKKVVRQGDQRLMCEVCGGQVAAE